jgi:hypothetical protein
MGPIVITPGYIEKYWHEQLDRIRAESLALEKQRKELEWLIREHDAKQEELRAISVEHRWHPNDAEDTRRAAPNPVQTRAREVRDVVMQENVGPPPFPRASQNVIAANMLLQDLPEPEDSEGQRKVARLKALLERAAVQQVESSAAQEASARECEQLGCQLQSHAASEPVAKPDRPPIQQQVGDGDVWHTIHAHRRAREEGKAAREC